MTDTRHLQPGPALWGELVGLADPAADPFDLAWGDLVSDAPVRLRTLRFTSHRIENKPLRVFAA